jgi:hypothetical protein
MMVKEFRDTFQIEVRVKKREGEREKCMTNNIDHQLDATIMVY